LVLLQKTLLNIEGLGRQLYDDLDLWDTAKPFLEKWMAEQIGPKAMLKSFKNELPMWQKNLPKLPRLALDSANNSQKLRVEMEAQKQQLAIMQKQQSKLLRIQQRNGALLLGGFAGLAVYLFSLVCFDQHQTETAVLLSVITFVFIFGLLSWFNKQ